MSVFTQLSPKARVFSRGFIEYVDAHMTSKTKGVPLRKAQDAGVQALKELGAAISVPYISKLTAQLENTGVIIKEREGKSFRVFPGSPSVWKTLTELIEDGFGSSMEEAIPDEVIRDRSMVLDFMNDRGAVMITQANPVSKPQYHLLMEKFKSEEYDLVFVKKTHTVFISDPKTNMRRASELT